MAKQTERKAKQTGIRTHITSIRRRMCYHCASVPCRMTRRVFAFARPAVILGSENNKRARFPPPLPNRRTSYYACVCFQIWSVPEPHRHLLLSLDRYASRGRTEGRSAPGNFPPVPSGLSNRPPSPLSKHSAKLSFCLLWENRDSGTYLIRPSVPWPWPDECLTSFHYL